MEPLNHDNVCQALDNLLGLLECSVCMEYMISPIYQCKNGHTVCSSCKPKVYRKCPSCTDKTRDIRCRALEKMADSLVVNCENKKYGCPHIIPYHTRLAHEGSCNFRPYRCPLEEDEGKCEAGGDIPFIVSHLMDCHEADLFDDCSFQLQLQFAFRDDKEIRVISCLDRYFYFHGEIRFRGSTLWFMGLISLIGSKEDVERYSYRLETGGEGWRLVNEGRPWSFREIDRKVFWESTNCLIVQGRNIRCSGETGKIQFKVTGQIWKTETPLPGSA